MSAIPSTGIIAFSAIFGSYYQKGKMNKLLEREKQTGRDPVTNLSNPVGDKKIHSSSLMWESVVIGPNVKNNGIPIARNNPNMSPSFATSAIKSPLLNYYCCPISK